MIVSIHQPDYIPYIGYFYKISRSDKFVFLDDCQFSNDNMHNWNRIKTPQGECKWKKKHLKTIEMNYLRAPYFKEIFPKFEELVNRDYTNIADMNIAVNTWIAKEFGFKAEFSRSSEMPIDTVNEERVIEICKMLGGDEYISGNGARAYQKQEHFDEAGVKLTYTDYKPIVYPQLWGEFIENMSVIDYIFNCGFDWDNVKKSLES